MLSGSVFFAPRKYKTILFCSLPSGDFNVSSGALAIDTTTGLPFRSAHFRYLEGNTSSLRIFRLLLFAGAGKGRRYPPYGRIGGISVAAKQPPRFELGDCFIDAMRNGDDGAGRAHGVHGRDLRRRRMATACL